MAAEGRRARTPEERERLKPAPGVRAVESPTKAGGWELHVPFTKRVRIRGRAEERCPAEPDLKVGTVDRNADSAVAAAWEGRRCGA
jgi:hypothetical protein